MQDSRRMSAAELRHALVAAREATLAWSLDLDEAQWRVPYAFNVQPTAWDLAHVGWFAEFWLLRGPHRLGIDGFAAAAAAPRFFGPDEHYDSARVEHPTRWRIELLSRERLLDRLAAQLQACDEAVAARADDPDTRHFAHLAILHELMHVEALAWTRADLGYPAPAGATMPTVPRATQVAVPAGEVVLGTDAAAEFAFDNETPPHRVALAAFTIDSDPVRNDAFAAFVDDGGYARAGLWPGAAAAWRARAGRELPARWRRANGGYEQRVYDRWLPLAEGEPVVHVNAYEAEAFCRWAGRRLPTAAEWEAAADRMRWGRTVWEWTADAFAPRPFFRPGPYTTYSAPWFHRQRELRGGAYTTHARMHDKRYRNFFLPWRVDVFAGFRTAADA